MYVAYTYELNKLPLPVNFGRRVMVSLSSSSKIRKKGPTASKYMDQKVTYAVCCATLLSSDTYVLLLNIRRMHLWR